MDDNGDWGATVRVEPGALASGDIVFVAIDASGSPSSLNYDRLEPLKIARGDIPDAKALTAGYGFVRVEKQTVCFVVTLGQGDVEEALIRNLTAALNSKEAVDARSLWLPLLGTGVGNLEDRKSLRALLVALRDSKTLSRQVDTIISTPSNISGEDLKDLAAMIDAAGGGEVTNTPPPVVEPVPNGQDGVTDFTNDALATKDLLDTAADARALATLICLEKVAPLAVAIFGGWGSGKSTFMSHLEEKINRIMEIEAGAPKNPTPQEGLATFVHHVVHIRFNAWQFVDANLWVSLTAEFFDQLRAGGWNHFGKFRHAELVERVNSHVHALSDAVEASRRAAVEGGKQLLDAQEARNKAAKAARNDLGKALGQATINALKDSYEEQKTRLRALGFSEDNEKSVAEFLRVVRDSASIANQIKSG
jgi:hypothetical protein